jgi:hypothetical protein
MLHDLEKKIANELNIELVLNQVHPSLKIHSEAEALMRKKLFYLCDKSKGCIENVFLLSPYRELYKHAKLEKKKAIEIFDDEGMEIWKYITVCSVGIEAVLKYITAEILELAGNICADDIIKTQDISLAIEMDEELNAVFGDEKVQSLIDSNITHDKKWKIPYTDFVHHGGLDS